MSSAHLYVFSDVCPSDWLVTGQEHVWHTIVNFVHQSDPKLQLLVEKKQSHEEVLGQDSLYENLISSIQSRLPTGAFQKWQGGRSKQAKQRYRAAFCSAFAEVQQEFKPIISACSFQEKTLKASKAALVQAYNRHVGGSEGRGIEFQEFTDGSGRRQMKHSFVNLHGYHEIQAPENQMLVLLLMSWFVADQFFFFFNDIVGSGRYGFDSLGLTVVSDRLSGDDDFRRKSEENLRNLIDPEGKGVPIVLTRSPLSDSFPGDLLVDNLAGWLTSAMSDLSGEHADYARNLIPTGVWKGWHQLAPSAYQLEALSAVARLSSWNCNEKLE